MAAREQQALHRRRGGATGGARSRTSPASSARCTSRRRYLQAGARPAATGRCDTPFRNGILDFTKTGIPVTKLGLFLGFQTARGTGGREGLAAQPWFRTVKWQALAARYVAQEMKVPLIWSWGWAAVGGRAGSGQARRPPVSISGRANPGCATGRGRPGRDSTRRAPRGSSILPRAPVQLGARSLAGDQSDPEARPATRSSRSRTLRAGRRSSASPSDARRRTHCRAVDHRRPLRGLAPPYRAAIAGRPARTSRRAGRASATSCAARRSKRVSGLGPADRTQIADFHDEYGELQARQVAGEGRHAVARRPASRATCSVCGAAAADEAVRRALGSRCGRRSGRSRSARSARPCRSARSDRERAPAIGPRFAQLVKRASVPG